jgi:putative copper export protein
LVTALLLSRTVTSPTAGDTGDALAQCRGLWLAGLAVIAVATLGRAWLQVDGFRDPADPFWPMAGRVLGDTTWGRGFMLQLAGLAFSLAGARAGRGGRWRPGAIAGIGAACLMAAPSWQGHAAGGERLVLLAMLADALHTASFAAWIGTLTGIWLVFLAASGARPTADDQATTLRLLVARFSPVALACGVVLATTGSAAAVLHLTAVADLWTSAWGRWLLAKLVAVAAVAAAGAYNWRIVTPRLAAPGGAALMRAGIRRELLLATAALVITAVLTGTGTPGSE